MEEDSFKNAIELYKFLRKEKVMFPRRREDQATLIRSRGEVLSPILQTLQDGFQYEDLDCCFARQQKISIEQNKVFTGVVQQNNKFKEAPKGSSLDERLQMEFYLDYIGQVVNQPRRSFERDTQIFTRSRNILEELLSSLAKENITTVQWEKGQELLGKLGEL